MRIIRSVLAAGTLSLAAFLWQPAHAEVRFGQGVRIGGHDFSNRTFNRRRSLNVKLYRDTPRNAGCRWVRRPGGKTQLCNLRRR